MRHLIFCLLALLALPAFAADWEENSTIAQLFQNANLQGTFVLYDISSDRLKGHNQARAETRYIPASTFKIANSLIGLTVGAVESVDEVLPYGGKPQFMKAWERDMGLREAIALSNVPIYQELARRIGLERMQQTLSQIGYGNNEIGKSVDTFWLQGPLKISAVEQTQFLARLAQNQLPLDRKIQNSVREILLLEQGSDWALYGKTGWQNAPDPGVGWWVGWVETRGRIYTFALNLDIRQPADAQKRLELGRASLTALGILPASN